MLINRINLVNSRHFYGDINLIKKPIRIEVTYRSMAWILCFGIYGNDNISNIKKNLMRINEQMDGMRQSIGYLTIHLENQHEKFAKLETRM